MFVWLASSARVWLEIRGRDPPDGRSSTATSSPKTCEPHLRSMVTVICCNMITTACLMITTTTTIIIIIY